MERMPTLQIFWKTTSRLPPDFTRFGMPQRFIAAAYFFAFPAAALAPCNFSSGKRHLRVPLSLAHSGERYSSQTHVHASFFQTLPKRLDSSRIYQHPPFGDTCALFSKPQFLTTVRRVSIGLQIHTGYKHTKKSSRQSACCFQDSFTNLIRDRLCTCA